MTKSEASRAAFEAAQSALFKLEEALGPYGDADRHAVYALRVRLGELLNSIRRREKL